MSDRLFKQHAVLLCKAEVTYGTDPSPTAAANAMLVRNMSINPLEGATIDLAYQRGYFGASKSLRATRFVTMQFDTDWMPGASTAVGNPSPLDPLLKACGLSGAAFNQTSGTSQSAMNALTGTAQTQSSTSATLIKLAAGVTQADDYFNGAVIRITAGKGVGQERVITDWVLSTKLATVNKKWQRIPDSTSTYEIRPFIKLASGASATSGIYNGLRVVADSQDRVITYYNGTNKVATVDADWSTPPTANAYVIDPAYNYDPISSSFGSCTIYYNVGGVRHKLTGCRGTLTIKMNANELPGITFNMTGLYNGPADASEGTPDFSPFAEPTPITTANTTGSLFGRSFTGTAGNLQMQSFSLDLGNNVTHRALVGAESVEITDRQAKGNISIEMTTVAVMDWLSIVNDSSTGRLYLENGADYGLTVGLMLPNIQLESLSYSDSDGIVMADMGFRATWTSGNDEVRLIEK